MAFQIWLALLGAAILISLSPGAGAATAMSYGLSHGVRGAAPAVAGLIAGYGTQMLVVAIGLGGLVATSPQLFDAIKWIGAAYLVWLGLSLWRTQNGLKLEGADGRSAWRRFASAYLVNITNPKGLVFLVALMPQFMDPNAPQTQQLLVITGTLLFVDWSVMTGYSTLASRLRGLMQSPRAVRWQSRLSGTALILAGIVLSSATL